MKSLSLPVTALSTYLYCPRKLYLNRILKIREPLNEAVVFGQVYHEVLENVTLNEKNLILSITKYHSPDEIIHKYKTQFYTALVSAISRRRNMIKKTKSNSLDIFQDIWKQFSVKAEIRAEILLNFINNYQVYGSELWDQLTPKIIVEQWVAEPNLELHGRVDRIEQHENRIIPVEIKSTKAPEEGIWDSHRVQLAAYMMILKANQGSLEYSNKTITLEKDEEMETEILNLIQEVKEMLQKTELPEINQNQNKCNKCGIRNECFNVSSHAFHS